MDVADPWDELLSLVIDAAGGLPKVSGSNR
jgi:hypothetical protein